MLYFFLFIKKEKLCCFYRNIDDVDKTMDEINDNMENMRQIQDLLSAPMGAAADFDEVSLPPRGQTLMGTHGCFYLTFSVLNRMNWKLNLRIWRGRSWRQSCLHLPQPLHSRFQCVSLLLSSPLGHLPRVAKLKMTSWQPCKQKWLCNYRYFSIFCSESAP